MITTEFILSLVNSKRERLKEIKENVDGIPSKKKDKLDPPEFNPTYRKTVDLWEKIRPHAEDDFFPRELFHKKAPNQREEEFDYCKDVYRITGTPTHAYWAKAIAIVNRIWNEKNYSIKYPEAEGVEYEAYQPKQYFEQDYPGYKSIEAYFREMVTAMKIDDPNAWLCLDVKVPMLNEEQVDQTKPVEPYMCLVPCYKVIDFRDAEYLLTMSDEKSLVDYNGKVERKGYVLEFRDETGLYKIRQTGKYIDFDFAEPELIYAWNLDYLPCQRLKGKPQVTDGHLYYQSYFQPAVSSLNVALIDANTLQVSKITGAFPERWEYVDDCEQEGCRNGLVEHWTEGVEEPVLRRCHACGGTGRKNFSSPLSVMEVPVPKKNEMLGPDTANMKPPFAGYVEKAGVVEMLKMLDEQVNKNCINAFAFLNLDVSNSEVQGSEETALGKQIDREELFSFLLQLANECFDLLQFSIDTCGRVRYNTWEPVEIGKPQNFQIRSDADLTDELSGARTSGLPAVAIQAMIKEYMTSRFNSRSDLERIASLIYKVDRFFALTPEQIAAKFSLGVAAAWEVILHDSIDQFIETALVEDPGFWDKDFDQQKAALIDKAKTLAAEVAPKRISVEDILGAA